MSKKTREIRDIISEQQINELRKLGVFKKTALRNQTIRLAYKELLKQGMKAEKAKELLADYYNKSFDHIEDIIYRRGSNS